MQLVEQHVIDRNDARYEVIDRAAFASKNLYNAALYELRQAFIFNGLYFGYEEMHARLKSHEAYKALPAKVAQQVLRLLDKNWKSYFAACEAWQQDPSLFLGHPKLPKYKDKQKGRNLLVFTRQAVSRKRLKKGIVQPSGLPIEIHTARTTINQVRIVPRSGYYVVEVIYEQEVQQAAVDPLLYAGIDIGIDNLVALTSNKVGFVPCLVNGDPSRVSINSITRYEQTCNLAYQKHNIAHLV